MPFIGGKEADPAQGCPASLDTADHSSIAAVLAFMVMRLSIIGVAKRTEK